MTSESGRSDGAFVGRRNELAGLLAQAAEVRGGHPRVALLTGEPGIGKTALAHRFVNQAQRFQLWEASGEEAEQLLTFGVIEQLVRAAPESGGAALADPGNRDGEPRDPIWVGAAALELLRDDAVRQPRPVAHRRRTAGGSPLLQARVFTVCRLQADRVLSLMVSRSGSSRRHLAGFHRRRGAPRACGAFKERRLMHELGLAEGILTIATDMAGDPPTVLRRPGSEMVETPHDHPHTSDPGATTAPVLTARTQGGA